MFDADQHGIILERKAGVRIDMAEQIPGRIQPFLTGLFISEY